MPSRTTHQSCARSSSSNFRSCDFGGPTRYCPLLSRRNARFASLTIPRSKTQMRFAFPYFASIISTISSSVVTSFLLPAKTSYPRGKPSVVTTSPMHTCLQSRRWSREWPRFACGLRFASPSKYVDVTS